MRRRWAVILGVIACLPLAPSPARAGHTPLNEDGLKWKNAAGADFNLEIAWTQGYVAQGAAFQQRVRDVVARDPSCFAGSCTSTSYARWYLHQAQPYFGGSESTVADFDPRAPNATIACGSEGAVTFHWLPPSRAGRLAETYLCPYDASDPTRVFSSQVVVNPSPPSPGTLDTSAVKCVPGPYIWFTAGPADANNDAPACRTYDLMSVLAHEVGHVLGFGEYRLDASGANSIDPVCLNGSETEDPRLGNNTNRETMCIPIFSGSERQRTPEEHEKDAFAKLYPPTGPAPTISPALQPTSPTTGSATWTVGVPRDSTRATTLQMVYGDGTYDTRSVPQGSGSASFTITHPFRAPGTFDQRATIVETGALAKATAQHGHSQWSGGNLVGYMKVRGSGSTDTVTATGLDVWNGPETMQQTVSAPVASAPPNGTFKIYTSGINTTDKYLRQGTYDVLVKNGISSGDYGYTSHTTWNAPGGACAGVNTFRVGTVTYTSGTDGVIDSAKDLLGSAITVSGGWAGPFSLPVGMNASPGPFEQAICVVGSNGTNGNLAPLDIT